MCIVVWTQSTSHLTIKTGAVRSPKRAYRCRQTLVSFSFLLIAWRHVSQKNIFAYHFPDFWPCLAIRTDLQEEKRCVWMTQKIKRHKTSDGTWRQQEPSCARSAEWRAAVATTAILEQPRRKTLISGISFFYFSSAREKKPRPADRPRRKTVALSLGRGWTPSRDAVPR